MKEISFINKEHRYFKVGNNIIFLHHFPTKFLVENNNISELSFICDGIKMCQPCQFLKNPTYVYVMISFLPGNEPIQFQRTKPCHFC